jgi:hypothetical protein
MLTICQRSHHKCLELLLIESAYRVALDPSKQDFVPGDELARKAVA